MTIFRTLNEVTAYIDGHLESEIAYDKLARMMGVSTPVMQRIFSAMTGSSLAEYIRKRRLSVAAVDLISGKFRVLDIAIKYGYDSSTTFSRAFKKFHGLTPSEAIAGKNFRDFPRVVFEEPTTTNRSISYSITDIPLLKLRGLKIPTSNRTIHRDAPGLFKTLAKKYPALPHPDYGMITYDTSTHDHCLNYYVLFVDRGQDFPPEFESVKTPAFEALKFVTKSQYAADIQQTSREFYNQFLPSSKYCIGLKFELEYYHDDVTELICPICSAAKSTFLTHKRSNPTLA